jgi:putative zinc finger/helix-turn-helix YgiT family protein
MEYSQTIECWLCGGPGDLRKETRPLSIRGRAVEVENEFYGCRACGEEFLLPGMMDAVMTRATARIRAEDGLLTSEEIRRVRETRGLTPAELDAVLGLRTGEVMRWERGTVPQDAMSDTLLRRMS